MYTERSYYIYWEDYEWMKTPIVPPMIYQFQRRIEVNWIIGIVPIVLPASQYHPGLRTVGRLRGIDRNGTRTDRWLWKVDTTREKTPSSSSEGGQSKERETKKTQKGVDTGRAPTTSLGSGWSYGPYKANEIRILDRLFQYIFDWYKILKLYT